MNKSVLLRTCACIAPLVIGTAAQAQNSRPAAETGAAAAVEEIIVTAQRREERLQDVPISISAVSGETLEGANLFETRNLTQVVPNLVYTTAGFSFQPTLRGVGTRNVTQGDEPNVAVYLDGIYQPDMASGSFSLLQVRQVEVLRGPQGTLFGRNATGGLINVITADPKFAPEGKVEVSYGRFDDRSVRGYLTGGLGASVAADVSFTAQKSDGYVKDLVRGGDINPSESYTVRSKILFEPYEGARIILSGGYSYSDDNSIGALFAIDRNSIAKSTPLAQANGPYEAALNLFPVLKKKKGDINLTTSWDLGGVTLATASSYQSFKYHNVNDSDGTALASAFTDNTGISSSYQQEVRLLSKNDSPFSWIVGGYAFRANARHDPLLTGAAVVTTTIVAKNRTESLAAFAEGHYRFSPGWSMTLGVRYTTEERRFDYSRNGVVLVNGVKTSYDQVTPKASIQGNLADIGMAYASYSRGFKSGVFNTTAAQAKPTRPEVLDAYEVGAKLDPAPWLRANFAVFLYKYKDIQLSARDATTPSSTLLNAAQSTIKGAEAEFTAAVNSNLDIRLNFSWLDAQYDRFPNAVVNYPRPGNVGGNVQIFEDESGKNMIRSPSNTASLGFNYRHSTPNGTIGLNGNAYYSAKYYWDFQNRLAQPSYTMIGGELYWSSPDDRYRVAIWGKNLSNEIVYQAILPSVNGDSATVEKPRTVGVSASMSF